MTEHARVDEYTVMVEGTAQTGPEADTDPNDEYRDTVTCSGGKCEIHGYVGEGGVDSFEIEGGVTSVSVSEDIWNVGGAGSLSVYVNGQGPFPIEDLEGVGQGTSPEPNTPVACLREIIN